MEMFSFVPINLHRCWPRELRDPGTRLRQRVHIDAEPVKFERPSRTPLALIADEPEYPILVR